MKNLLVAFLVVLCLTAASTGTGSSFDFQWRLGIMPEPTQQGWDLEGFANASVDQELKTLHLELAKDKPVARLYLFAYAARAQIASQDYCAIEIKMRAAVKKTEWQKLPPVLRFSWRWHDSKTLYSAEVPLVCDDGKEFHVYKVDLAQAAGWGKVNKERAEMAIYPVCNASTASIDITDIKFVPFASVLLRERLALAEERISAARDMSKALAARGLITQEVNVEAIRLATELKDIRQEGKNNQETALARFSGLADNFSRVHKQLDAGRRLADAQDAFTALVQSVEFNRRQRIAIPVATEDELTSFGQLVKSKNSALLDQIEAARRRVEETMSNNSDCWLPGVSNASFGRFGWVAKDSGMLLYDAGRERLIKGYFECAGGANPVFKFSPVGCSYITGTARDISWVSSEWEYLYQDQAGSSVSWNMKNSLLAPGTLLTTNVKAVRFAMNSGLELGPTKILAPCVGGTRILSSGAELASVELTENWLLLLCDNDMPATPWLLTFEKKPDAFKWERDALIVSRASGVGTIGMSCPWGVKPLPINFSQGWQNAPAEVVEQARRTAAIMNCYPYKCDEFYTVDKERNMVRIAQKVSHLKMKNDWNSPGRKIAPFPPVLAFAIESGYPAKLGKAQDFCILTKYGPYMATEGALSEYQLPIPDLRNPTPLKTDAFPQWAERANFFAKIFFPLRAEHHFVENQPMNGIALQSWCLLDTQAQQMLLDDNRRGLEIFFEVLTNLGRLDTLYGLSIERTEPFTGANYLAYGWTSKRFGKTLIGDVTNFSGMQLRALNDYCKYSGDWDFAKRNWPAVKRVFGVCPKRSDWACMGLDCMEYGFMHTIDMGPDSWGASCHMAKIAEYSGDQWTEKLAIYMAAKQAVTLVAAFSKRRWDMAFANTWNQELQLPETGYTEDGNVNGVTWQRADLAYNFLTGVSYKPECFQLYADFCPEPARNFEFGLLERFYPQWNDPRFKSQGKELSNNQPAVIAAHLALREALGEPTDSLAEILRRGTLEGSGEELHKYVNCGSLQCLYMASAALLIGRDAPCRFAGWGTARLLSGYYDSATMTASGVFQTAAPFVLNAISHSKPSAVVINGKKLEFNEWRFDSKRRELLIPVANTGAITITINYAGLTPKKQFPLSRKVDEILWTREMQICAEEKSRTRYLAEKAKGDFPAGDTTPIDIASSINMDLRVLPQENDGKLASWFGMQLYVGKSPAGTGLSGIPHGLQRFRGVTFKIDNGVIGLQGTKVKSLPRHIGPLKIGKPARNIYFLHTAGWDNSNGEIVLRYIINYSDGEKKVIEVRSGQEIADWWVPRDLGNAKLAAKFSTSNEEGGHEVGIYAMSWKNTKYARIAVQDAAVEQRPLETIESLEIESSGEDGGVAVLSISIEL